MLVLSRRAGQSFWIGEDVRVTVLSIERGRTKLGIEAPREVGVRRDELAPKSEAAPLGRRQAS